MEKPQEKMVNYKILTVAGEIKFIGKYRRDLEAKNWHYYESKDGTILHFRKENIVCVVGDSAESIIWNRHTPKKPNAYEMPCHGCNSSAGICNCNSR